MEVDTVEVEDIILYGFKNDHIFKSIQKTKQFYEYSPLHMWAPLMRGAKVIFDVGANIGNHSVYWSKYLTPERIYSFEPIRETFSLLEKNAAGQPDGRIHCVNKAVGKSCGYASVHKLVEGNMGATTLKPKEGKGEIELVTLDDFIEKCRISIVDFIKIDTEGFEVDVLQGMQILIQKFSPDLWIEVSAESHAEVIAFLEQKNYFLCDIEGFNLLFLHKKRHDIPPYCTQEKLLKNLFAYQEKSNLYYQNYEKAKNWRESDRYKFYIFITEEIEAMKVIRSQVKKIEMERNYLLQENLKYKKILAKITDTRLGNIGIDFYKFLRKCKWRLNGLRG